MDSPPCAARMEGSFIWEAAACTGRRVYLSFRLPLPFPANKHPRSTV